VALINGKEITGPNAVQSLLAGDSLYRLRAMPEHMIDFGVFRGSDLVVLNGLAEIPSGLLSELQKFTSQGGAVVIIPAASGNTLIYRDALATLRLPGFTAFDTAATRMDEITP